LHITLGIIASACILAIPNATVRLGSDPTSMLGSLFLAIGPLSYLRIISAFFLTSFFSGIAVFIVFFKKHDFNVVEKLSLIILISYCFTMVSGLLLGYLKIFSTVNYVLTFWIFSIALLGYKHLKLRKTAELSIKSTSFTVNINLIAIAFAAISLVILSYIQVLASSPMNGIVGGDVLDYMVSATRFPWSDFAGWSPYVWSNNIYGLISNLSSLPPYFVYLGLQFYLIIPIGSLYFLTRTIFPKHEKIAAIATLLCFFAAGITSWVVLKNGLNLANLNYTGFSGITPLALSPWILDFGFLFFALAFIYKGVFEKERKLVNYVLPALFAAAAFFSHSLNIILVFIFSLVILGLFVNGCRAYVFKLSLLTFALVLALDPLSKWMLIDNIFAAAVGLNIQSFESINLFVVSIIAIGMVGLFAVLFAKKRNHQFPTRVSFNLSNRIKTIFLLGKIKLLFYIIAFTFFGIVVFYYLISSGSYSYNPTGNNYPLEWTLCRSFGVILPFALASIPFMVNHKRYSLLFTSALSISIFISAALSIAGSIYFPAVIPPYIGYVRYISYLVIPLSILAAFGIFNSLWLFKKRHFKFLFVILLVVLVSTSILSQAYGRERLYDLGQPTISVAYNLPDISGGLNLTGDVLAKIYLGIITNWNDPQITTLNPSVTLPNRSIITVHRLDDSEATNVFTKYLATESCAWNSSQVGSNISVQWPVGEGQNGNDEVAKRVNNTQYTIGYVELANTLPYNLTIASVQDTLPVNPILSVESAKAVDWINNNIPKNTTILPLSLESEKILSNFVSDVKVTPNFQIWYLNNVLSKSSDEVIHTCLRTLGINYVFVASRASLDISSTFNKAIQSFQKIYPQHEPTSNEPIVYEVMPNNSLSLPYFDSLFQKITFSLYEQHTGSTPMNNKVIWFSNISATGDIEVSSNAISINESELSVHSIQVTTNNGSVSYEGKMLSDFSVKGAGVIFASSMKLANLSATMGFNTLVDLVGSQDVSMLLRNAEINFKLGSIYESFNNANISIILKSPNSLDSICKQPLVAVNGNLTGNALGLVHGETFDYGSETTLTRENVNLPLTIELPLTDNLLYSQVTNAKVDKSLTQ
jgi:hypothetical protein